MCRHYNKPQGCSYGEKCQFAHGANELRTLDGSIQNVNKPPKTKNKLPNPLNYKIVKCKNWEKDGTCKYGENCTFAHGDSELREKQANANQFQPNMVMYAPFMVDPMGMMQMQQMGMPMGQMGLSPMMMQPMAFQPINSQGENKDFNQTNSKPEGQ